MSFAIVIVLYRSRDELAHAARRAAALPQLVVVDNGPDDGGAALAAQHGATVIERRDNPGFGAACNLALEHVTEDVTVLLNPDTETGRQRARQARPARPSAADCTRPDWSTRRDRPAQRASAPRHARGVHPRAAPDRSLARRAVPRQAAADRRLGRRRRARRPDGRLRELRFDPSIHLWAEDMDLCLRARAQGIRTILPPRPARLPHGPAQRRRASRSSSSRATAATSIQRTRGTDRAAPRRRRATAHVRHASARQAPERKRARPTGRAP